MIADIPYAEPSVNLRNEIIELVQYLVDNPHITDGSKTAVQEKIDNKIFELYGISDDDKLVIENFCSK